jgi:geranylgeranylglycerol-phosphate geranylgeranyltransferase
MASLAVFAGAFIASGMGITESWMNMSLAMLVVFLFTGGGNALNDYVDRDIDKNNHPERPIPSGEISARSALHIGILSLIIPVFIGFFINTESLIIILIAEALMLSYEFRYKKTGLLGNIEISIMVGMLFLFGGASVGNLWRTGIFSIMASLATLGREIVKDIEDMEGDTDRITLPKRIGRDKAGIVAAGAFMAAVSLSSIPYRDFGIVYLIIVSKD